MERKTQVALIVILCIVVAAVILVMVYFDGNVMNIIGEKNHAKDYILDELGGEIVECTIDEEAHMCYLIYREDGRKVGEIWIYYYPGGIEPYKVYTIQGGADQMIRSEEVTILLKGSQQFREDACELYNEKFGFRCTRFERP